MREAVRVHGVFEGGGVRGIALAGAAAATLDAGFEFDEMVGTSAGGLIAGLVAAGYRPDELARIVSEINWPGLLDPSPGRRIPVVGQHLALMLSKGLYRGDRLEATWHRLLRDKGVVTFADLPPRKLRVVATDLNHQVGVVLPDDLEMCGIDPNSFSVARALRMSAAVPFMFQPVPLTSKSTGETILFGDGAMASNFPIGLAGGDRPVLGFRLMNGSAGMHPHLPIRGPASLAHAVMISGIRSRYGLPAQTDFGDARIIEVAVERELDFDLDPSEARALFDRGYAAAKAGLASSHTPG